jgi:hypothetical protein
VQLTAGLLMIWIEKTASGKQEGDTAISIRRTLKSVNKYRGSLHVAVTNNRGGDISTRYLETLPWFVQLYLHTLRIECNGTSRGAIHGFCSHDGTCAEGFPRDIEQVIY